MRRCARRCSGRHSAQRAKPARPRVSRRVLAVTGAVVLVAALGTFGVLQWRGGSGGDARPASLAETSAPVAAPLGAVPSIAATVPEDDQGDGPVGDRRQCALCAKGIQERRRRDRRVRCRPDERGRADAGAGAGLPRDGVRGDHPVGAGGGLQRRDVVVHRHRRSAKELVGLRHVFRGGHAVGAAGRVGGRSEQRVRASGRRAYATIQETEEIPAKSEACEAAGSRRSRRWSTSARTI